MNAEDATVPTAVARPSYPYRRRDRRRGRAHVRGGRLIYAGAGTAGRLGVLDASECPPTFDADPSEVVGLIAGGPSAMVTSVESEDSKELAEADLKELSLTPDDTVVGVSTSAPRTPSARSTRARAAR